MRFTRTFVFMALAGMAGSALATNGYFLHGYGTKAKGRGGAATATADDAFGGANNPASMAFSGDRLELGVDLFSPRREAQRSGLSTVFGVNGGFPDAEAESGTDHFLIPELGFNKMIRPDLALGVTIYGNGGMNTDFKQGQTDSSVCTNGNTVGAGNFNLLCGEGELGVDLAQAIIAPTVAYKFMPNHSIGVAPLLGVQRFKARGLGAFSTLSQDSNNLTNKSYDYSFGYGVRVGYFGQVTPTVSIGAAFASKMYFDEFEDYKGLFAEQGDFDIPSNWNLGVAWQATPRLMFAFDYQRINYDGVDSVSNRSTNQAALGADNGPGFGWTDIDVFKLGVEFEYSKALTLRAGWNHGENPIEPGDVTFNIIAPGVVKDHATLGLTYTLASGDELSVTYMHAFRNSVKGASVLPPLFTNGGLPASGTERIEMYQNSLGVQYSWKL